MAGNSLLTLNSRAACVDRGMGRSTCCLLLVADNQGTGRTETIGDLVRQGRPQVIQALVRSDVLERENGNWTRDETCLESSPKCGQAYGKPCQQDGCNYQCCEAPLEEASRAGYFNRRNFWPGRVGP